MARGGIGFGATIPFFECKVKITYRYTIIHK